MVSSTNLKPKEKGKISVSIDLHGRTGNVEKKVQVYTNDPKNPVTVLTVRMTVHP